MAVNPTGIQLPDILDDPVQRKYGLENIPAGRVEGFEASTGAALHDSTLGQGFGLTVNELVNNIAPGRILKPDEWKASEHYRPGLNFPDGVSENVARLKAADFDGQQERQTTIEAMPSGFVSGVSKLAGGLIGFTAGTPFLGVAASTLGRASTPIVAGLSEAGAVGRVAGKAIEGAIVGGGITAPQEALHLLNANQFGEDYTALDAITNIGANAGLGALLHMGGYGAVKLFEARKPFQTITTEADRVAKESAVAQMAEGKSVDVEPAVRQGFADARLRENMPPDQMREQLTRGVSEIDEQIKAKDTEINLAHEELTQAPEGETLSAVNMVNRVLKIEEKPIEQRTPAEQEFLTTRDKTDEIETLINHRKQFDDLTPEQIKYADEVQRNESKVLESRIARQEQELEQLKSSSESTPEQINELTENIEAGRDRLERLSTKQLSTKFSTKENAFKKLDDLHSERNDLLEIKRNHEAAIEALNKPIEPVTKEDMQTHHDKMRSVDSDSAINPQEIDAFEREAQALSDDVQELLTNLESQIKDLEAREALTAEERAALEEVGQYESRATKLKAVFKSAIDCLVTK